MPETRYTVNERSKRSCRVAVSITDGVVDVSQREYHVIS